MNKLLKWSLTAALAGFLFGFDTVVISGADQKLQELWNSSDIFHGSVVMAMALWGTVIGARTVKQLDECLDSQKNLTFSSEELKAIDKYAKEEKINLWAKSSKD